MEHVTDLKIQNTGINANPVPAIPVLFEIQAARYPVRVAVKSRNRRLTYAELNCAANRLAHAIVELRGLGSEPIALLLSQDVSIIVAILAVLKAGKFYVSLEHSSPEARLAAILDDAQAPLIVTDAANHALATKLNGAGRTILNADESLSNSDANLNVPLSSDDMLAIFYTSGSTGTPKGVMDHQIRHLQTYGRSFRREDGPGDERIGLIGSPGFAGYRSGMIRAFLTGAGLYLYDISQQGLGGLCDWLMEEEITTCTFMASVFRHFVRLLEARPDLSFPRLQVITLGGERSLRRDFELFKRFFSDNCRLRISYASTEAGAISSYVIDKETQISGDVLPVGYAAQGKKIMIWDEADHPVGPDQIGEIVIQSRHLASGYWHNPELTEATFLPAPDGSGERIFHTGDLGRMRADGLLEYLGRKDAQVKIRGHRVETGEIEMRLLDLAGIQEAHLTAQTNSEGDPELVAYLVTDSKFSVTVPEIREALAHQLPDHMIPARYVYVDSLPLLPTGKVDARALPPLEARRRITAETFIAPRDRCELELVQIWQDLLGVQPIGVTDNFFDLGGHSLLAGRLLTEIEKRYARKFPPRVLVQASTVEQLAAILQEEGWEPAWSPLVPLREQGTKPPLFYIPPFNYVLGFYPLATYLPADQPIYALLASPSGQEFPFTHLEEEAAFYVKQVKTVQPHGPYHFLGWSYGGVTAFEMAQQLLREGERVAFLGVLDIGLPLRDLGSRLNYVFCRSKYYWGLGMRGLVVRLGGRMRRFYARQFDGAQRRPIPQAWEEAQARPDYPEIAKRVGFRGYVPKKYPGRVTLFQVQDTEPHLCRNVLNSWVKIAAGGVQTYDIPGVHNTMLLEPYVRDVAEKLQESLVKAQS